MTRQEKKFFKKIALRTQREIWQTQFNIAIVDNLVLGFSKERLKLLKEKEAMWTAKDGDGKGCGLDKKQTYDALKKLKSDILKEENTIKGTNLRKENYLEEIRVRKGKLDFLRDYIAGKYE
jgi:hypothetical protein